MTARTVTGNIQQVTGAASPGGFFVVTPENPLRAADSDSLMIGESFRVTADGSGDISFVVEEGTYQITATTAAGDFRVRMVVDSEGPWTIGRLVGLPVPITPGLAQQVFDAADAAAASAAQAALYDGPKVDTFAELDALTAAEIDVGDLVRVIETGAVCERVASGADFTTAGGIGVRVLGPAVSVRAFGYDGSAASTSRAQIGLNWLGAVARRSLIWDVPNSNISGTLNLPDASRWDVNFPTVTQFIQSLDNTPCFVMSPSANRFSFGFSGQRVWFVWENDQPSTNTLAIGIAFNPTTDLPDGIYDFYFDGLHIENGYDLLVRHPSASGITCPYWGYRIGELHFQSRATGRAIAINSGVAAGAPAGVVDKIYANCLNSSANVVDFRAQNGVRINSLEINNAQRRSVYFESAPNCSIGMLRFELCELEASEDLMSVAGSSSRVIVESLELQAVDTAAASDCFGVVSFGGAVISVTGAVTIRDCEATGAGRFRVFRSADSSGVFGKFILPPNINMQTDDNNVTLYEKTQGAHIAFASSVPIGPFVLASVSGVSSFTSMVAAFDGSNTYFDILSPVDGFLTGVHIRLSAAITAGTLTFFPQINGASIGGGAFSAQISSGQDASYYGINKWEPSTVNQGHRVLKGDRLRVLVTPSAVTGGGNATVQLLIAADPT